MGLMGTAADLATDILILAEIAITVLVILGVRKVRRRRNVSAHRRLMLATLILNAVFLAGFLVADAIKSSNVVLRNPAPAYVFWPLLSIHLAIAVSALAVAVISWRIARAGIVETGAGIDLSPEAKVRHRRVSRHYPWLWYSTLVTGLMLYGVVYVVF